MRILFCNKYNFAFSGTEVYLFELIRRLTALGHETALFSMRDARGDATPFDKHFVPHIDFKNAGQSKLVQIKNAAHAIYSPDARRRLRAMIAEFRPDVAHVRNIYHHLSPSILWELRAQSIPILYHLNDFKILCPNYNFVAHGHPCEKCAGGRFWNVITEGCHPHSPAAGLLLAAEAYTHGAARTYPKCVTRFLAPSRFVKDKLVEHGYQSQSIEVLPHFQELPEHSPAMNAEAPVLYFGRLSPEKGVEDLLQAAQRLPHVRFQIAGDGPQRASLEAFANTRKLRNVAFLGHVPGESLQRLIASSRFTVLPSHAYETLGKSILESYAWARPVIASDLGSRREFVREGETGLLYRPGDAGELAAAISFLDRRPQLVSTMGAAGHEQVRRNHDPETHCRALTLIYESLRPNSAKVKQFAPPQTRIAATEKPLKIAFIGGRGVISKYSGIESYYEEVGSLLAAKGHALTVYCRNHFTPKVAEHKKMKLVRLPSIRSKHLDTLTHTLLSTLHVMWSDCDIVNYHALGSAPLSFLPRLVGKKTVVTVQGLDWQRKKWNWFASSILRLAERASSALPDKTILVSKTLHEHYQQTYPGQSVYIPNGATLRRRTRISRLPEWGLAPDDYILFMGRLSPEKNCHLLIEAFKRIKTSVKLVLAGGSSHSRSYVQQLHRHRSDRIIFVDWVSGAALDELLTNAMLFVLPSDMEGLSLALLDAMAAGVCVLASDIPENVELVHNAGFTFQKGNVDDLERALMSLIWNPMLREHARREALTRVTEEYLWPKIADQVEAMYFELMGRAIKQDSAVAHLPAA